MLCDTGALFSSKGGLLAAQALPHRRVFPHHFEAMVKKAVQARFMKTELQKLSEVSVGSDSGWRNLDDSRVKEITELIEAAGRVLHIGGGWVQQEGDTVCCTTHTVNYACRMLLAS